MGPLVPVIVAIVAWGCSPRYGIDEDPIVTNSGTGGRDTAANSPDASSYSDAPHVELPNDAIQADLFAKDSATDVTEDAPHVQDTPDTQADIPITPGFCESKLSLSANSDITEIAAGGDVSCLIKSGTVFCTGKINASVDPNTALFNSSSFVKIPSLAGAKHLAVGGSHICAIMPDNGTKCLGQNLWGQLGNGTTQDAKAAVSALGLQNSPAISLGGFHSLGMASGQLFAWGLNSGGQLGLAAMPLKAINPQLVTLPENAKVLRAAAGALHSVAISSDGTAYAWGNNALFSLGVGATGKVLTPKLMQNSSLGIGVAAGADFTLLLDQGCTVSSVGAGGLGQLGLGGSSDAATLTPIPSLNGITAVVAGGQHACAISIDGALSCWGENNFGAPITSPTQVMGSQSVVQVSLGTSHRLALTASGQVFVWGKNNNGQLGTGTTNDAPSPTSVTIN